jgi:acyl-CoA reductase-like NAD-dependent aldehyde dehydrogenase
VDKVHAHVQEAVAGGAKLVTGGQYDNLVYYPTVVADVTPDMRIFTEQTFGPVAPIVTVSDPEEALAVANNSAYGLSAGIISSDFNRGSTSPCVSRPAWSMSTTRPSTTNLRRRSAE